MSVHRLTLSHKLNRVRLHCKSKKHKKEEREKKRSWRHSKQVEECTPLRRKSYLNVQETDENTEQEHQKS